MLCVCRHPARLRWCSTDYLVFCGIKIMMFCSKTDYDVFLYLGLDSEGPE
jgi:hypothetical protein